MSIILSSIKRSIRDKSSLLGNLMLVLILPFIFSMMYNSDLEKETINLGINGDSNSQLTISFVAFMENFDKENENIDLNIKVNDKENSSNVVIEIDESNKSVEFKGSKTLSIGENIVAGVSEEFFNMLSMEEVISQSGNNKNFTNKDIIKSTIYENNEEEINYQVFFSIVMLEMVTLVSSIFAFKNTFYIKENIGYRAKTSPIKISKLMTFELLGSFIIIFLESLAVLFMSSIIYGININLNNIVPIVLLLGVLSLLAVSLGILCSAIAKKKSIGENMVSLIVTVITLASGKLMPHADISNMIFTDINPFKWIHHSLCSLVESGSTQYFNLALGMTMTYSIIMMIIAIVILNRRVVD